MFAMESSQLVTKEIKLYPEGSNNHCFLKKLGEKLSADCLTESGRKELNESHADLKESIQQYFKQHIIYTSTLKAVDYSQLQQHESACGNTELFHLNLLRQYVHNDKSCEKLKLFEGSQALLTKILKEKQKSKSVELFTKLVEDNINEFCLQFLKYASETEIDPRYWKKTFDTTVEELSERVALMDSTNIRLNNFPPKLQNVLSSYHEVLAEGILMLNESLELFEQKIACQENQTEVANEESNHLFDKMQCMELEIMVSTYFENAVKALQIIKTDLDIKIEASKEEIEKKNTQLEGFQILGPEYDQLVDKYQQLTENIEKQRSTIEYLKAEIASKEK